MTHIRGTKPRRPGTLRLSIAMLAPLACAVLALHACAASAAADDTDVEPRVARLAFSEGEVSYLDADADEWAPVEVNAPLVTGDRFYAGPDARAEVQLPGGVYARLAAETELDLLEVSSRATHVRVGIGTATFRVRDVPVGLHVEISTPSTALVARSRGTYRVDVAPDGQTTVLVRDGELDAYRDEDRYRLESGRGARFVPAVYQQEEPAYEPVDVFDASSVPYEPWDEWERDRARRVEGAASLAYVSDDVYGVEELDAYGTWDRHETYGPIWRPAEVAAGWAPYTTGRWVWQDPWGWTWVDYAPWGWAPAHHGRWVYVRAWAWAPGPVVRQPVYAPATVGFLGVSVGTPSVSVSIGVNVGPSVGWVPLGWGEPIIPWWRGVGGARYGEPWWGGWGGPRVVNNTIVKNVNVTNIDVTNIRYAHSDRPRALTAVHRDAFLAGRFDRLDLPERELRRLVRPLRRAPDLVPERASLLATRPAKLRADKRTLRPADDVLRRAALTTRAVPDARPELRTVQARGKRALTPEITAAAPTRSGASVQRTRRDAGGTERRAASAPERTPPRAGEGRRSSPATVARPAPRPDAERAAPARESRRAGTARAEREPARDGARDTPSVPSARTAPAPARRAATTRSAPRREERAAREPAARQQRESVTRQRRAPQERDEREAAARPGGGRREREGERRLPGA